MAKIRNRTTGQIIEVPDNQLGQYGFATPTPSPTPTPSATPTVQTSEGTDFLSQLTSPTSIGSMIGGLGGPFTAGLGGATGKMLETAETPREYLSAIPTPATQGVSSIIDLINLIKSPEQEKEYAQRRSERSKEALTSGVKEGVYDVVGGLLGKLAGKVLSPATNLVKNVIPEQLYKLSLPEKTSTATNWLKKIIGQEVKQEAGQEITEVPAKDFAKELAERKIVGGPKSLIKQGMETMNKQEDILSDILSKTDKPEPNWDALVGDIKDVMGNKLTKASDVAKADKLIEDKIIKLQQEYADDGWKAIRNWVKKENPLVKGGTVSETAGLERSIDTQMRNTLRSELGDIPGVNEALRESEIAKRLEEAAASKGIRPAVGALSLSAPIWGMLSGGGIGDSLAYLVALNSLFQPGLATPLAQGIKLVGQAGEAAIPGLTKEATKLGERSTVNNLENQY